MENEIKGWKRQLFEIKMNSKNEKQTQNILIY